MVIELDILKKHFPKDWVDNISRIFNEYVLSLTDEQCPNKEYFIETGHYVGRNDKIVSAQISEYFNRTLYAANIAILHFVCLHLATFKNLLFVDNGAGFGLLSVYLKHLGINCINYDEFTQVKDSGFAEHIKLKTGIEINKVSSELPDQADVLTNSFIWVTNPKYLEMNFRYLLFDYHFRAHKNVFNYDLFQKVDEYQGNVIVFKRK